MLDETSGEVRRSIDRLRASEGCVEEPLWRPSASWEGIRRDSRCDIGSGGTGGGELGGNETASGTAGCAIIDFERVRHRVWIPPNGSSLARSTDPFIGVSASKTSSWSSLCVLLTLLKKGAWSEAEIRSLTGVGCCGWARFPCVCVTGGKISI